MPDFAAWLGKRASVSRVGRSEAAWARIQDKPTSIVLVRRVGSTSVSTPAQTVRLEPYTTRTGGEVAGAAGQSGDQDVIVFGVRGHGTVTNTDIRRDDRFTYEGKQYRVVSINTFPNSVQALAEALS